MLSEEAWLLKAVNYRCTVYLSFNTESTYILICQHTNTHINIPPLVCTQKYVQRICNSSEKRRRRQKGENGEFQHIKRCECSSAPHHRQLHWQRWRLTVKQGWREQVWTWNHTLKSTVVLSFSPLMSSRATLVSFSACSCTPDLSHSCRLKATRLSARFSQKLRKCCVCCVTCIDYIAK